MTHVLPSSPDTPPNPNPSSQLHESQPTQSLYFHLHPSYDHPLQSWKFSTQSLRATKQYYLPSQINKPICFTTANKDPNWRNALVEEMNALQNITLGIYFHLVPIKKIKNVVSKWVFLINMKVNASISDYSIVQNYKMLMQT